MSTIEKKRQREQDMVEEMIGLYCRKNHRNQEGDGGLCPQCQALSDYARVRSERCPFMDEKSFCSNCAVHCYGPDQRREIKKVMAFSGPRMIFHHPLMSLWHLISTRRRKHD